MKIHARLFGGLRDRFPRETRGRGDVELPEGSSVAALLERLEIPPAQAQMVLVNGERVPREPGIRENTRLADGDTISIFPPLAGG